MEFLQWLVSQWICKAFNSKPLSALHQPMSTQTTKGLFGDLSNKGKLGRNSPDQTDSYVSEYLWCQDCKNEGADPFQELLKVIKTTLYLIIVSLISQEKNFNLNLKSNPNFSSLDLQANNYAIQIQVPEQLTNSSFLKCVCDNPPHQRVIFAPYVPFVANY